MSSISTVIRGRFRIAAAYQTAVLALIGLISVLLTTSAADGQFPPPFRVKTQDNDTVTCNGQLPKQRLRQGGGNAPAQQPDLLIDGTTCTVKGAGSYNFGAVNILNGGNLVFQEPTAKNSQVNFWASSIIVEYGGSLIAGSPTNPYGSNGGTLTIYLYGSDQSNGKDPIANPGAGAVCLSPASRKVDNKDVALGPCGIPFTVWRDNGSSPNGLNGTLDVGGVTDRFYQYAPLYGDSLCSNGMPWNGSNQTCPTNPNHKPDDPINKNAKVGYFGYKVMAVSYGGTLRLFGYKGTPLPKGTTKTQWGGNGFPGIFGHNRLSGGQASAQTSTGSATSSNRQNIADYFRQLLMGQNGGGSGSGGGNPPSEETSLPPCATAASDSLSSSTNPDDHPTSTGCSWLRLAGDLKGSTTQGQTSTASETSLTLSSQVGDKWWSNAEKGDQMVVTTSDYLPRHSELLTIDSISGGDKVTFHPSIQWPHNGTKFSILDKLGSDDASRQVVRKRMVDAGMAPATIDSGAETRAAVALLTRSIRIVSGGDKISQTFAQASSDPKNCKTYTVTAPGRDNIKQAAPYCYYFGAHAILRQGFRQVEIQGVEFQYMGQGGKMGHYPIHFHKARQVPSDTFVKDSSINESMTRWIVLHSTQGVLLQRNIGWQSIGHGFMLEDGTETDNKFYSNLGIFARAAIDNDSNPRKVPGILAAAWLAKNNAGGAVNLGSEAFPFRSDYDHPAVFWIANGWNDFAGNMAAGAGACGMSYWLVPAWDSDMPDVPAAGNVFPKGGVHMKWSGYAGVQFRDGNAAMTPFKSFSYNSATTSMGSFSDVGDMAPCQGIVPPTAPPGSAASPSVLGIPSFAPIPITPPSDKDLYYPHVAGGGHQTTRCPLVAGKYDCTQFTGTDDSPPSNSKCNNLGALPNCAVMVLDHYISSFHWAQTNFAAVWSRPQWFLLTNGFLSDVQNGGITSFTSGDYSRGAVVEGDWALARTTVFVGNTQTGNAFSANSGPFANGLTNALTCDGGVANPKAYCLSAKEGISMPLDNFGVNQRLFNIYDGPMYEDANMFLDITQTPCASCMYAGTPGVRKQASPSLCYLPNAAISWKQPNGFFYPPSFHSNNLFFNQSRTVDGASVGGVDIRHYVIDALFQPDGYKQNPTQLAEDYCKPVNDPSFATNFFEGFTDIDRQTELNDDDGSLTGLTNDTGTGTISVNPAEFFNAPLQTAECLANLGVTAKLACPDVTGKLPPKPTSTSATTSPYDYVTTVVYPQCGVGQGDGLGSCESSRPPNLSLKPDGTFGPDGDGAHFSAIEGRGGSWSKECANPACYGVPLYRQFLTGLGPNAAGGPTREASTWMTDGCNTESGKTQAKCRWPFVRMGGQSTFNRSSLTVNHGAYYLDTSVTWAQQNSEPFSATVPCPAGVKARDPACAAP